MKRILATVLAGLLFAACSSDGDGREAGNGDPSDTGAASTDARADSSARMDASRDGEGQDAAAPYDAYAMVNWDAYFAMDPPPKTCLADGGRYFQDTGVMVGVDDPTCPSDRNREGCPCDTQGTVAPCWPGLRANRNRGQCHDGMTTCTGKEFPVWSACQGAVLPTPMTTRGPGACNCFSAGNWDIANISPCFITASSGSSMVLGASSSSLSGTTVSCGSARMGSPPWPPPSPTWSTSNLTVDCGGQFRLCYRLRAYASMAAATGMTAADSDCTMAESCVDAWLTPSTPPAPQTLPPLPGWTTSTAAQLACAQRFVDVGGYGEMVVQGLSAECTAIDDGAGDPLVFNRLNYCPLACSGASPPAMCAMCSNGAAGSF